MPRGVLANVHDGKMEPEDLGETDDVAEITIGDQIRALTAQRLVDEQEILQQLGGRRVSSRLVFTRGAQTLAHQRQRLPIGFAGVDTKDL